MSSKLPKPSGLKPPQFRSIKPLGTISENVIIKAMEQKTKAHEAPPSISRFVPTSRLKRRSKSVTDLRTIVDKPLIDLKPFKLPLKFANPTESKQQTQNKNVNSKVSNKAAPVKPVASTGTKRALANKSDEGVSKPKVSKKIPDWDYKGRFNQLNEKYHHAQECIKEMRVKVTQFDEIQTNYTRVQEEAKALKEIKATLEAKCEGYDQVKSELSELKSVHESLNSEHKVVLEKNRILEIENASNLEEAKRMHCCYDELTETHEKLTCKHKEQTIKLDELTEKSSLFLEQNKQLLETVQGEQKENSRLTEIVSVQRSDLIKFETERRILHNVIQDLKGNIRVFCRVRPPLPSEIDKLQCCINFIDENGLEIRKSRESVSQITGKSQECKSEFLFDKVFSPENTQEEVFEDLAQLVQSALDGYDVCVFAYGQTGSGKTYTMQGAEGSERGMIPRTIHLIFENIAKLKRTGWNYSVQASFLEIYNENVRDLLNLNHGPKLEIYYNEGKGTTVTNLTKQSIESAEELEGYTRLAQNYRATAATDFNEHSSRSHAVTKIYLQGTLKDQNIVYTGSINLVDLAGSENAKQSVIGDRLTETKNINKSLATLGDVICALHNKSKHVPYRNSKLTYLLQSSLGGNSKTLMIVNVAPFEECHGESISSLRFAAKVKEVKTGSKRNKMMFVPPLVKEKTTI